MVADTGLGDTIAYHYNDPDDSTYNGIYVGQLFYIHLTSRTPNFSHVHRGDSLGIIIHVVGGGTTHLHFQSTIAPFYNPLGGGIVDSLTPFTDTTRPTIIRDTILFYPDGGTVVGNLLSGIIDIDAEVYDKPNRGVSGPEDHLGRIYPYKISFQIVDTLGNIKYDTCKIKFDRVPPNVNVDWLIRDGNNAHPVFRITNVALNGDTVRDHYWNTKQKLSQPDSVDADSIEDAKFKDGKYWVKVLAYDIRNNADTESVKVHVDNFNPRVKQTDPPNWFAFVPTKKHRIWCFFSEAMDTTTLTTANIKIQSLKADSFNYPITNITYVKDSFKLYLTVDSFRFKDTVQVRLLKGVKDLAGKSIQGLKPDTVAYFWTFVVGVIQLTDNDLYDVYPDVYHGKIVWTQAPWGNDLGEIILYDFYNNTTDTISPGGGIHTLPYIYQNKVAWTGYGWGYTNPVYYYNGSTTQEIAPANKGRYSMEINEGGVVWRAYKYLNSDYDSIWVEYYNVDSNFVYAVDSFVDYWGRYRGWVDIDRNEFVWDHSCYPTQDNEIYRYKNGVENFTNDPDSIDCLADIDCGQIVWIKYLGNNPGYARIWFYDGANSRKLGITQNPVDFARLCNGCIAWVDQPQMWLERLSLFDGRNTIELMRRGTGYNFPAIPYISLHNKQVGWLRLVHETMQWPFISYYNVSLYDGEKIIHLTIDTLGTGNSNRIEIHDGFVVYDAWDGNDYEIYLYLSDTLFTPPAVVKNLQGEVLGGKSPVKKVKLTWKANTEPDLVGYKIYRSDIPYQYGTTPYATVLAPETTLIDTLPFEGMNYYVATAYDNLNNEGGFSNQVSVFIDNIPPAVPANLVASYDSVAQKVSLIWRSSPDGDLKLYRVYRSEVSGNYTTPFDSVFKPDTTFIDSTIFLGKTYYYVVSAVDTNKNESGFSNEDTVIVPSAIYSDFAFATAYNNGRKIVSSPTGDKIHLVYANEGWLMPAGIYYSRSTDSGKSFSASEFIDGPGMYPALAIDTAGNPCASWVSGSYIYYTYWTSSWAPPDTWQLPRVIIIKKIMMNQ